MWRICSFINSYNYLLLYENQDTDGYYDDDENDDDCHRFISIMNNQQ